MKCQLNVTRLECASIGVWAHQSADMGAASGERPRDVTANEAVGAGYECNSVSHKSLCLMRKKRSALRCLTRRFGPTSALGYRRPGTELARS